MKRFILSLSLMLGSISPLFAQHFSLYNTGTLYDSFENPVQKAFKTDTTRKYAFNFFIPTIGTNAAFIGPAQLAMKTLAYNGQINTQGLNIGNGEVNTLFENSNVYLLSFKIFNSVFYNRESGFSWQIRSDGHAKITNESLALFEGYKRFPVDQTFDDVFNDKVYQQTYHQFSYTYRENYYKDKRLSFGVKLSLLTGIAYTDLQIDRSQITYDQPLDKVDIALKGSYRGNLFYNDGLHTKDYIPNLKNPGASFGFASSYKFKDGTYLMGSIKDLGFIRWNSQSYNTFFNGNKTIEGITGPDANKNIKNGLSDLIKDGNQRKGFFSPTNAKIEGLISKSFGDYTPNFIVSKELFFNSGDIVLANTYKFGMCQVSLTGDYNLNKAFMVGTQFMVKSPNFEFFLGSDNVLKSYYTAKGAINNNPAIGSGYSGASFYMGFSLKFGPMMEHPLNANTIPGMKNPGTDKGFFGRIFGKSKKKS